MTDYDFTAWEAYALGPRSASTVEKFLKAYVDKACLVRQDTYRVLAHGRPELGERPLVTLQFPDLQSVIQAGMEQRRVFFFSLPPKDKQFIRVTLGFCEDDTLVFGLSRPESTDVADVKENLMKLIERLHCRMGLLAVERAPPLSEKEFKEAASLDWVLCFWSGSDDGAMPRHDP
ncbi:MAG: hypothetical protein ABIY70_06830 [Capsulimonas sp.]|uniref:hypothetical protein n=1 Tax=Capsulimonas sp. TaxID=2494211 RepID=UPI00326606E0